MHVIQDAKVFQRMPENFGDSMKSASNESRGLPQATFRDLSMVFNRTIHDQGIPMQIKVRTLGAACKAGSKVSPIFGAVILLGVLSGCGSKPGNSDIAREMSQMYACKWLEIAEAKKLDGMEDGNRYGVEYSFQARMKGGEEGAR